MAEYDMKLMDIDSDQLGIPDTEYDASVTMYSAEFSRIVRDLSQLGESVRIEVSKEGVRFMADGESANGSILMKHTDEARSKWENLGKDEDEGEGADVESEEEVEDQGSDEEGSKKRKAKVKKEKAEKKKVKKEQDGDGDEEMANGEEENEDGEFKAKSDDEGEEEMSEDEKPKKKKKPAAVRISPIRFVAHRLTKSS